MKSLLLGSTKAAWILCCSSLVISQAVAADRLPNIVLILVDDLGKEWVSCYGAEAIATPNVDRLASEGMRFDNYYCMPQCTPTRLTLLTGQYPFRHGWVNHWDVPRWGGGCSFDPVVNPSVANMLRQAGYATVAAGKWQIDDFREEPQAMVEAGFDAYCMWTGYESDNPPSGKRFWDPYVFTKNGSRTYPNQFGPDLFCDFLIDFMREHRDEPMFVYFPMVLTHPPLVTTPAEPNVTDRMDKHRAMVRYTDQLTGRLVRAIEDLEIAEDTILIWTTDNGTSRGIENRRQGHLVSGGKSQTKETGVCVPFIAWAPGRIAPGQTTQALVDATDLFPTFAQLAKSTPLRGQLDRASLEAPVIDGVSFASMLSGSNRTSARRWIMAMGGRNEAKLTPQGVTNKYRFRDRVLRDERFKLEVDTNGQVASFYDLTQDPSESTNLIDSDEPAIQAAIHDLKAVADSFPRTDANPRYRRQASSGSESNSSN